MTKKKEKQVNENTRMRVPTFEARTIDQIVFLIIYKTPKSGIQKFRVFNSRRAATDFMMAMSQFDAEIHEGIMERKFDE